MTALTSAREEAIEGIKHLKGEYLRTIDAKDWDAFALLFTPDCEFTTYRDVANTEPKQRRGPDAITASVRKTTAHARTRHRADLALIRFNAPNEAEAEWDMTDEAEIGSGAAVKLFRGAGRYFETYKITENKWLISRLELKRSWIKID